MSDSTVSKSDSGQNGPCILYCNCSYAKVVPADVKKEVLAALSASGLAFDAVPDLCDMSARKDPALARLSDSGPLKIVACYERAVRWLFHAAKNPLPADRVEILNMREEDADTIVQRLLAPHRDGESIA